MADPKTPKLRSPFFRVAVEGATSDGRQIERAWIEQAAASYNPKTYGARIWMEHIRSSVADSPFKAYGDVVAVKAEEVEINGQKRRARATSRCWPSSSTEATHGQDRLSN